MMGYRSNAMGALAMLLNLAPAMGDVVFTSDGSRIVGRIEQVADGRLIITTEIAGQLDIDTAKVTAIDVDRPVNVQFASGDRLVGTIESQDGLPGGVMHTALGAITIDTGGITALWPEGAEDPAVVAMRRQGEEEKERLRPKWSVTLEAGGVMKEGNTDTLDARGRFDVKRRTSDELLEFFLAADYSEQKDQRTRNEYRGGIRYENSVTPRNYWYTRIQLEFDEFEDLDLRSTAAAGTGYYWLKQPEKELKTSLGIGYRHESFDSGTTTDAAVLDLGLNYDVDLASWAQFTHASIYSPDIEELGDYRLAFDTAIVFPLKHEEWKLKVGMRNEYNSTPPRGIERLDNTWYANVVLTLR